ncbi:MAG: hypothetical protein ACKO7P_12555 [Bacteroidota bacterium]
MARLFVFAIGGTGSRVIKSLSMLLASGVQPKKSHSQYEIIPIIIDPHKSNEDLKRTDRILGYYEKIHEKVSNDCGFFGTKVTPLSSILDESHLNRQFTFNIQDVANTRFRDYLDYHHLSVETRKMTDLLFSGTSVNESGIKVPLMDVEMNIGFVGNPNIGSIVLHQFVQSDEFIQISSQFNAQDRIFIISSIFGGTGAAGFPTILKAIRDAPNNPRLDGVGFLQNAKIGAVTVLPYFNLQPSEDSPIQKSDFIAKTKAALHYYKSNVSGNNELNAMYYIGDDYIGKALDTNDPGHNGQKNNAHVVELAAAYSIINFLEISDSDLETVNGNATNPIYREYSLGKDDSIITIDSLGLKTKEDIAFNLTQFVLFKKFLFENLNEAINTQPWSMGNEPFLDDNYFKNDKMFRDYLEPFLKLFDEWLVEMKKNDRSFSMFNDDSSFDYNALIEGRKVKTKPFNSGVTKVTFNDILNRISAQNRGQYSSKDKKLIKLFFDATNQILKQKYGFN